MTIEEAEERMLELLPLARDARKTLKGKRRVASVVQRQAQEAEEIYRRYVAELNQLTLYLRSGEAKYPSGRDSR